MVSLKPNIDIKSLDLFLSLSCTQHIASHEKQSKIVPCNFKNFYGTMYWKKIYTTGGYLILFPVYWNRHRESGCVIQRMEALRFDESSSFVKSLDYSPFTKLKPYSFYSSLHLLTVASIYIMCAILSTELINEPN